MTDDAGKKRKVKKDYSIAGYTVNGAPYDGKTAVAAGTEVTVIIRAAGNGSYTDKVTRQTETLVCGTDYEIESYKNNNKKGTATVAIRGIGRYGGTKTVEFAIVGASMN